MFPKLAWRRVPQTMVYLCWAKVAQNVEDRLEKADRLVHFMEWCAADGFVWMIVVDHEHILCRDPDLENTHLVLCIIDYDITDSEKCCYRLKDGSRVYVVSGCDDGRC